MPQYEFTARLPVNVPPSVVMQGVGHRINEGEWDSFTVAATVVNYGAVIEVQAGDVLRVRLQYMDVTGQAGPWREMERTVGEVTMPPQPEPFTIDLVPVGPPIVDPEQ